MRLAHAYDNIVQNELPTLIEQLKALVGEKD